MNDFSGPPMLDRWFVQALIGNGREQIPFPENISLYQYLFYKATQNKNYEGKKNTLFPTLPSLKEEKKERE